MTFLETPRLCLRTVAENDAGIMFDYRNNELCSRYQRSQATEYGEITALIQRHRADELSIHDPFLAAVALKDTDEMVGEILVMPNDGTISLGYTISYRHHRKGYAYEALKALLALLHENYPDWEFISFTEPENTPSRNLLEKLGYRDFGYLPSKHSQVYGKWTLESTHQELSQLTK